MRHDDTIPQIQAPVDRAPAAPAGAVLDPHRPRYHYLPLANWLNDPNGLIHWKGEYHLFYQYNPNGPFWGTIEWGHAVSHDLVHWTGLPVALRPTPGSYDADGCFSGCAVNHDGVPTLIYTGVRGTQHLPCLATSADDLRTWQKYPGNPIITAPPAGLDLTGFRDHSVWEEGATWYQVIGSGIAGAGGTAFLYRSPDLITWEYLHPLYVGDGRPTAPLRTGTMWECPDFFPLGGRHVLIVSAWEDEQLLYPVYFAGTYADHRFTPEHAQRLDYGASLYAPQTLCDAQNRRILWGWLREERDAPAQLAAGWSGVMSLPRVLTMRPDGLLEMRPAPELAMLRGRQVHLQDVDLAPGSSPVLDAVRGAALEIAAEFARGETAEVGVAVRCAPDGREQTWVRYDWARGELTLDSTRSSLSASAPGGVYSGPLALAPGEPLRLHIFVDGSVVEVFANERACLTSRIYPSLPDSLGLGLAAADGAAHLRALDIWELAS